MRLSIRFDSIGLEPTSSGGSLGSQLSRGAHFPSGCTRAPTEPADQITRTVQSRRRFGRVGQMLVPLNPMQVGLMAAQPAMMQPAKFVTNRMTPETRGSQRNDDPLVCLFALGLSSAVGWLLWRDEASRMIKIIFGLSHSLRWSLCKTRSSSARPSLILIPTPTPTPILVLILLCVLLSLSLFASRAEARLAQSNGLQAPTREREPRKTSESLARSVAIGARKTRLDFGGFERKCSASLGRLSIAVRRPLVCGAPAIAAATKVSQPTDRRAIVEQRDSLQSLSATRAESEN